MMLLNLIRWPLCYYGQIFTHSDQTEPVYQNNTRYGIRFKIWLVLQKICTCI